ncbi:MAG: 50S ribosomal protein L21 [Patescibacteria group bacterium]
MEFAVIQTGGKQYPVKVGDTLEIEKMEGVFKAGDPIIFDKVLLIDDGKGTTVGTPHIAGAKVEASFEKAARHAKLVVLRYKAKSRYKKVRGHRQPYFKVKITAIKK